MKEKRVATTKSELIMVLVSVLGFFALGLLVEPSPTEDIFFFSLFGMFIVLPILLGIRKRYSWFLTLFYYLYMIVLTLLFSMQHPTSVTLVSILVFLILIGNTLSENERLIHKVFF